MSFWNFYAVIQLLGLLSAIRAIYYARNASSATAWAISLMTLPMLVLPFYWVLSFRTLRSYLKLKRSKLAKLKKLYAQYRGQRAGFEVTEGSDPRMKLFANIASAPVLKGNWVWPLVDGVHTYKEMFSAISKAQNFVLSQFFIIEDDEVADEFIEILCQKAQQGVAVYLLYDAIGTIEFNRTWKKKLQNSGVNIGIFAILKSTLGPYQINFRNHRKVVIIDGKECFLGGMNIGASYLGMGRLRPWRDTMMHIKGPVVRECQILFFEDWHWACDCIPPVPLSGEEIDSGGQAQCLVLGTGPADQSQILAPTLISMINSATTRLWLATPYYIPDESLEMALRVAVKRGVDVRLIFPKNYDHVFVWLASQIYLQNLVKMGVKVYLYEKGFMHQKVVLVDQDMSLVGSANLDTRSLYLNFELGLISHDQQLAKQLERMLLQDFAQSNLVDINHFTQRNWAFQFSVRFAYLFSSIL